MDPATFQLEFLKKIGDYRALQQLLDLMPEIAFFVKDRRGRFVLSSRRATDCCRVNSEAEVIGKNDYDFFPDDRCALYRQQDQQVMRTGEPIINAVCPTPEEGSNALIIYSKVPLRDGRGRVIGVAGIHRELRGQRASPPMVGRIARAVAVMHERYAEPLRIAELAAAARLSRSQFDRQFRRLFGTTPREYLQRVRVSAACRLLEDSDQKTTQIALATGFYDHSHFSRTFRRIMGSCPLVFRRRHAAQRLPKS
jgi:AraC-like DNA-binding protein